MVDPRDIKIVETTPGGGRRAMAGVALNEEFWNEGGSGGTSGVQGISSIGETEAMDMANMEFQVNDKIN